MTTMEKLNARCADLTEAARRQVSNLMEAEDKAGALVIADRLERKLLQIQRTAVTDALNRPLPAEQRSELLSMLDRLPYATRAYVQPLRDRIKEAAAAVDEIEAAILDALA